MTMMLNNQLIIMNALLAIMVVLGCRAQRGLLEQQIEMANRWLKEILPPRG